MTVDNAAVRLFIYESARRDRIPAPREIAREFGTTPRRVHEALRRLVDDEAIVLLPGSTYIWMAEPFSAVPTDYPVVGESTTWFGNCIWDALAIASLADEPCRVPTTCPESGTELELATSDGRLVAATGVVHFSLPPSRWWESIGFT